MESNKIAHLEMIQGVINRLSTNSFLLKGWSVVVLSGLFAIAAASSRPEIILSIAFIPLASLWALDAYFLRQERLFRHHYDAVRSISPEKIDFSMTTTPYADDVQSVPKVMLSATLLYFYGPLALATTLVLLTIQID